MIEPTPEALFLRYRETGDPQALAFVFDRYAPQLLLVAAHLAGGPVAEDLVQETFLDAIRQRERWDAARPLAPWLVGLLGNHVRQARRQRRRVPDPQRIEQRESERPDDVAAANECAATVHAAVERLPRHYRQVLSLRLVHGLELQQIANSLDVPLGTVKVRLHRGVALLRRALPAGLVSALAVLLTPGNGLAAVRQVVVGHAGLGVGSAAAAAGFLFGGWVMKKVVVGVVVVVVIAGAWFGLDAVTAGAAPVVPRSAADPVVAALAPGGVRTPVGEAAIPILPTAIADTAAVREAAPTTGGIAVQVTWASDGVPAGDIEVSAYRRDRQERAADGSMRIRPLAKRASDAHGKLQFDDLGPGAYFFQASNARSVPASDTTVVAGAVSQGNLAVEGDVRLAVLVVDEQSVPCAGVDVLCEDRYQVARCLGLTDAAGTFAYRGLHMNRMWGRQAGRQPSAFVQVPAPPEGASRDPIAVRLVLGALGCAVAGTVVDPRGLPVAGARVFVACDDGLSATRMDLALTTDASGRFHCDEVPVGERYIVADALGFAPAQTRLSTTMAEPVVITLALPKGAVLSGCVTDSAGQPLVGIEVTTRPARVLPGILSQWGNSRTEITDAEGRYRIAAILPGETEVAVAVKPRIARQFTLADGEERTFDVAREPERSVLGVVLDAEDKPLPGWRAQLTGGKQLLQPRNDSSATTDAAGRFRIDNLEDAAYRLFVFAPEGRGQGTWRAAAMVPRVVVQAVRPSSTELIVRLDAVAMASGWIEGSIAMPEGLKAEAVLMLYARVLVGGGFTVPTERLAAGTTTFRLGPLPAGEYDLLCDVAERGRLEMRGLRLAPGATLKLLPFAVDAQRPLQLVLRHADGRPAAGAQVRMRPSLAVCTETAPGCYESPPLSPGSCEALVHGPDFAPCTFAFEFAGQREPVERTVPVGTPVQFALKPATPRDRWVGVLQVRIADAQGTEVVARMVQIDGKQDFVWPLGLLPGTYSVRMNEFGGGAATTTIQVTSAPLRVELQLAK